jgi:hypothetical protein
LFFDGPARKGADFRFAGQRSDPVIQAVGLVFIVYDEQLLDNSPTYDDDREEVQLYFKKKVN